MMHDWASDIWFETREAAEAAWTLLVALVRITGHLIVAVFSILAFCGSLLLWLLGGFAVGYGLGRRIG